SRTFPSRMPICVSRRKVERNMAPMTIQLAPGTSADCCGICGKTLSGGSGPRLFMTDKVSEVCRDCGSKHAPGLVALLHLAPVADRVGSIGRHTLVPPLAALLDLARAAENYNHSHRQPCRQAA